MRITSIFAGLFVALILGATADKAHAGLIVSVTVAPPPLVVYAQPPVPGPGYLWEPGYWAWDEAAADFYWVPGAWVPAPEPGLVWTPGYWGWSNGVYVWNAGYWGDHVGFYGGIDYGFGYTGAGFAGGYWAGGVYYYNRSVTNTGRPGGIANVYRKAVPEGSDSKIGFNGGNGGVRAQPTVQELETANERHIGPSADQLRHQELAAKNPDLKLSKNHGRPAIAATTKAADFSKGNVIAAKPGGSALRPAALTAEGRLGAGRQDAGREAERFGTLNRGGSGNRTKESHFGAMRDRYGTEDPRIVRGDPRLRGGAGNRTTEAHFGSVLDRYRAGDRRTVRGDPVPRGGAGNRTTDTHFGPLPDRYGAGDRRTARGDPRPRPRGDARSRGDGWPGDARRPIDPASGATLNRTRRPGPRPAIKAPPKNFKKAG